MATFETRFGGSLPTRMDVQETPTAMSDVLATKLGLKVYRGGSTYNGGVTIAGVGATFGGDNYFIPYQVQDGSWRCLMMLHGSGFGVVNNLGYTIVGISVTDTQAVPMGSVIQTGVADAILVFSRVAVSGFTMVTSGNMNQFFGTADIALSAKPSWAY